jgi:hypothetical protein
MASPHAAMPGAALREICAIRLVQFLSFQSLMKVFLEIEWRNIARVSV